MKTYIRVPISFFFWSLSNQVGFFRVNFVLHIWACKQYMISYDVGTVLSKRYDVHMNSFLTPQYV